METDDSNNPNARELFEAFRADPRNRASLAAIRQRTGRLALLLANPKQFDPATFNREVWRHTSSMTLNGQPIVSLDHLVTGPQKRSWADIEADIEAGRLEAHGNSVWEPGSSVYRPGIKITDAERESDIQRALAILNGSTRSLMERAHAIAEVPGFGLGTATGLLLITHPTEFALYNKQSIAALNQLGLAAHPLEAFEEAASRLREELDAKDFLELDVFLYQIANRQGNEGTDSRSAELTTKIARGALDVDEPANERSFWWVNQGSTYRQEKEGAFLWAPKAGKSNVTFGHWTNVFKARPRDIVFHYANNEILAVSQVQEPPTEQPRPAELPEDSWEKNGYLARVTPYQELDPPIRRADIPHEWRIEETTGPFTQDGNVKQGYLFPLTVAFVQRLAGRFPQLGTGPDLRLPQKTVWLFQANPNFYHLSDELQREEVGQESDWSVTRYKDRIRPGDDVVLWQGGREAGIYATAEVTSRPFQRTEVGDWMVKRDGADAKPDLGVRYRLTRILNPPIPKAALQLHPILKNLMVLRAPTGTNFAVTEQEWSAIRDLMGEPPVPPPDYVEPQFSEILAAIRGKGLRFSDRTVRRYHLSLKPRGFVILSGISGGGKTQLARAYAEAVGADHLVVSVAPNWNTNEDLLGFFNPVHKQYVDTPFSHFLRRAAREYQHAVEAGRIPRPFHVILDEMNLARVEHYFASFLSAMELRAAGDAEIALTSDELIELPPNLAFVGTVNVDETTHGFANKVYDRAQLVEIDVPRELIVEHLAGKVHQELILEVWDRMRDIAPFAFRVLDDIDAYVGVSRAISGATWQQAVDDQLLQKILPKLGGADDKVGAVLDWIATRTATDYPLTHAKAAAMAARCHAFGFTSYF